MFEIKMLVSYLIKKNGFNQTSIKIKYANRMGINININKIVEHDSKIE